MIFYFLLDVICLLLKFFFLKLEESLFFHCRLEFLFYFFNSFLILLVQVFDFLNITTNGDLLSIDSILMCLVEVSLLPQLLPGALGLLSRHLRLSQLGPHLHNLLLKPPVLILNISYQPNLVIMERPFLLQLVPFLLEHIQCLSHSETTQEVPNEIVNYYVPLNHLWLWVSLESLHGVSLEPLALALLAVGSFCFEEFEVIEVVII